MQAVQSPSPLDAAPAAKAPRKRRAPGAKADTAPASQAISQQAQDSLEMPPPAKRVRLELPAASTPPQPAPPAPKRRSRAKKPPVAAPVVNADLLQKPAVMEVVQAMRDFVTTARQGVHHWDGTNAALREALGKNSALQARVADLEAQLTSQTTAAQSAANDLAATCAHLERARNESTTLRLNNASLHVQLATSAHDIAGIRNKANEGAATMLTVIQVLQRQVSDLQAQFDGARTQNEVLRAENMALTSEVARTCSQPQGPIKPFVQGDPTLAGESLLVTWDQLMLKQNDLVKP